jgi:hypothetical protein
MKWPIAVLCQLLVACGGAGKGGDVTPPESCSDPGVGRAAPAADCSVALPSRTSCAESAPRYDEIAPIVADSCTVCHFPGGVERVHQFDTYALAYEQRKAMLVQVYGCRMPPPCQETLDSEERMKLLTWLVCDAPVNSTLQDGGS